MLNKKKIILLVALVVVILILQFFAYKFGRWYEQTIGHAFVYVSIVVIALFILSPFKILKDKRKPISLVSYGSGLGTVLASLLKFVLVFCKETVSTITYIFVPKLFKAKESKENNPTEEKSTESI